MIRIRCSLIGTFVGPLLAVNPYHYRWLACVKTVNTHFAILVAIPFGTASRSNVVVIYDIWVWVRVLAVSTSKSSGGGNFRISVFYMGKYPSDVSWVKPVCGLLDASNIRLNLLSYKKLIIFTFTSECMTLVPMWVRVQQTLLSES